MGVNVHTLLRISRAVGDLPRPSWVRESLRRAPWVVVRRAVHDSLIPVGVRGDLRAQRFAAWVSFADVLDYVTPQALASERAWRRRLPRCAEVPALAALDEVQRIMSAHGLGDAWGPAGSVGFELASGCATAKLDSDLDVVVNIVQPLSPSLIRSLQAAVAKLSVRADVLLETLHGAIALGEYAKTPDSFMLRTLEGPKLVSRLPV